MYPQVEVDFLRDLHRLETDHVDRLREQLFGIAKTINPLTGPSKAVAISFFRTRLDNTYPGEYEVDEDWGARWRSKYYERLLRNLEWFETGFDTSEWKLVAYVCPHSVSDLGSDGDGIAMLAEYDFIEIHVMSTPSVGHNPGASWRFLSMGDESLDRALILDIDEPWSSRVNRWHPEVEEHNKAYNRAVHMPREGFWLSLEQPWAVEYDGSVVNYPPVLSSKQYVTPRALGLTDIDVLMAAYVALRMKRSQSANPCSQLDDDEPITPYNRPYGNHLDGWGNHWYQYCHDERFLKHVVYRHAVQTGSMCTYCLPQDAAHDLGDYLNQPALSDFLADFRETQTQPDNIILNNGRIYTGQL